MVAVAGSTWKLAPCLVQLFKEADSLYPGRPTVSDGTIGDAAHSARTSDHNPDDDDTDPDTTRWVCAGDLTDALPGPVALDLLEHLRTTRDPRVKYGISEGRSFYSYANSSHPAWVWVPYSGPNGHFQHGHISVHNTAAARNDLSPWFPSSPSEDDDMTPEQVALLVDVQAKVVVLTDRMNHLTMEHNWPHITPFAETFRQVVREEVARIAIAGATPADAEKIEEAVKQALREGTG